MTDLKKQYSYEQRPSAFVPEWSLKAGMTGHFLFLFISLTLCLYVWNCVYKCDTVFISVVLRLLVWYGVYKCGTVFLSGPLCL